MKELVMTKEELKEYINSLPDNQMVVISLEDESSGDEDE